ncbi:hypothetical protein RGL65_002550 [Vibrio parahaemolyticus]|nr:hypothetical protein [Vibrio parahaemolyticus]
MDFEHKAERIRNKIRNYTTESLLHHLLVRLHGDYDCTARAAPWVSCMMLDWSLELEPIKHARDASHKEVYNILNEIWNLQNYAIKIRNNSGILELRPFILSQIRFQSDYTKHIYFLLRLKSILCSHSSSELYRNEFKRTTGLDLNEFFIFSLFLLSLFGQNNRFVSYEELFPKLYPAFSYEKIYTMLTFVGATPVELRKIIQKLKIGKKFRSEDYFSEPLTINKPILILPEGISTPNIYIACIGISEMVMRSLKNHSSNFKNKFTLDYEKYVSELLIDFQLRFISEFDIKDFYKKNDILNSKSVDFIIVENDKNIYLDAKGTEPTQRILTSTNPKEIKERLSNSYLKGILQACDCSDILFKNNHSISARYENRYALIVTHQDYYLGDGISLVEYLGNEYGYKVTNSCYNKIPIENIHFISIEDFESLLLLCSRDKKLIHEFLDFCIESNKDPRNKKFTMKQHIESFSESINSKFDYPVGYDKLVKIGENLFDELDMLIEKSVKYWNFGGEQRITEWISTISKFKKQLNC